MAEIITYKYVTKYKYHEKYIRGITIPNRYYRKKHSKKVGTSKTHLKGNLGDFCKITFW